MDDRQGSLAKLNADMKTDAPASPTPFKLGVNDSNVLFSCTEEGEQMLGLIGCYEDDTQRLRIKIEVVDGNRFEVSYDKGGNVMSDKPDRTAYTKNAAVRLTRVKNVTLIPRTFRLMEVKHFFVDGKLVLCPNAADMRPPIKHRAPPVVIGDAAPAAETPAPATLGPMFTAEEWREAMERASEGLQRTAAKVAPADNQSVEILVNTGTRDLMFNVPFNEALDTLSDWRARGLECT